MSLERTAHIAASLARQAPTSTVACCSGAAFTGQDVHDHVATLSHALTRDAGIRPGDRVALVGAQTAGYFAALLACTDAGAIACPLNTRWSAEEMAAALRVLAPAAVLADSAMQPLADRALDGAAAPDTSRAALLPLRPLHPERSQPLPPQPLKLQLLAPASGVAVIAFTSGTTGAPKGAMLSHAALHHQSLAKLAAVGYSRTDTYLHLAPLFHVGGLSSALAVLLAGGCHVFLPRYAATAALQLIRAHSVTALAVVPAMVADIAAAAQLPPQQGASDTAPPTATAAGSAPGGAAVSVGTARATRQRQQQQQAGEAGTCPSVRVLLVGAGALLPQTQAAAVALFPHARVCTAYGMTEAASSITFLTLHTPAATSCTASADADSCHACGPCGDTTADSSCPRDAGPASNGCCCCSSSSDSCKGSCARALGRAALDARSHPGGVCVGRPVLGAQVRVDATALGGGGTAGAVPAASGRGEAAIGEVITKGPHLMSGYWAGGGGTHGDQGGAHGGAAACPLAPGGWLRTGDLGWLDGCGRLWLVGRLKDVVKSGGENVMAAEVEAVLRRHAGIADAAVVGLPHPRWGEQVAAAVVLRSGWRWASRPSEDERALDAEGAREWCSRAGLSGFKAPKLFVALSGLPTTSTGKVRKPLVQELLQQHRQLCKL